jgi:mono/diheme cytochrome c family protein
MKLSFLIVVMLAVFLSACSGADAVAQATEPTAAATPIGDVERGRELFETGGELFEHGCIRCHSLDGTDVVDFFGEPVAPSMQGISERAGARIEGMSAVDYVRQSIVDPNAYTVEGYEEGRMSTALGDIFSDDDINALIAFILTQ